LVRKNIEDRISFNNGKCKKIDETRKIKHVLTLTARTQKVLGDFHREKNVRGQKIPLLYYKRIYILIYN
jgi:hypothetical protein